MTKLKENSFLYWSNWQIYSFFSVQTFLQISTGIDKPESWKCVINPLIS